MSQMTLEAVLTLVDRASAPLRQLTSGSNRAADALGDTRRSLRDLQGTMANVQSFRRVQSSLDQTRQSITQAEHQLEALQHEMRNTERPTAALRRELDLARRSLSQLRTEEQEQVSQLGALRSRLTAAGVGMGQLGDAENRLRTDIERTTASLNQQQHALNRRADHQRRLDQLRGRRQQAMERFDETSGTGAQMMATGAVAMAGTVLPMVEFAKAEDAATQLKVSMMGVGGKVAPEFEQIKALADELGNKLPGTTADFQAMMSTLIQQGISAKAILGGVGQASAYLGVQLQMPFDAAAEFAAKMQDATKTAEGDMLGLMDTIQRSYYLGVDSTNMLAGFSNLSVGMKTIKQQGLEGAKAMAPLLIMADQASMGGEKAGNAYSKIFKAMLGTKKINKALEGTKLKLNFTDGKGEFGGLDKMYKELEKLKPLTSEQRVALLGDVFGNDQETLTALDLLIDKGKAGYDETVAKMQAQADLQTRVNEQLKTLKNLWDAAGGTFSNAMVALGESIAPQVKELVEWIADLSERLGRWAKANPVLAGTLMKVVAAFGALLFVLGGIAVVVSALLLPFALMRFSLMMLGLRAVGPIGMLANAFRWLGMVVQAVFWALMANPILAIILGLAVAALLIYRNWGPIKTFFIGLWNSIVAATSQGIEAVVNWFSSGLARARAFVSSGIEGIIGFFTGLYSRFTAAGGQIIQGLLDGLSAKWEALKAKVASIASSITDTVKGVLGIHSPSRVFAELGGHTMTGLTQGLLAGAGAPVAAVANTSAALRSAVDTSQIRFDRRAPLPRVGQQTSIATTAPITINVYATPGMDTHTLAQQVAAQLEQQRQQDALRHRSRLHD